MVDLKKDFRKLAAEAMAVFMLNFFGGWSVMWAINGSMDMTGVAIQHGLILIMFIWICADISGGHVNPAVTIALWSIGKMSQDETIRYVIAQSVGSLLSGFALLTLRPESLWEKVGSINQLGHPSLGAEHSLLTGVTLEFLASASLMMCVMVSGIHKKHGAEIVSLSVGFSVAVWVYSIGPYTGGAQNPARVFGPAFFDGRIFERGWWIYIVGPIAGMVSVAKAYTYIFLEEEEAKDDVVSVALDKELGKL